MSSARVEVALALVAGAMSAVALWLVTDADGWGLADARELPIDVAIGVSYSAAAVLVLAGTGGRRIGWLLLGVGLCGATASLGMAIALTETGPAALVRVAGNIESWIWVGGFVPLLTLVPMLYPDGRVPGPRWRVWVVTSLLGMVLLAVGSAAYPGPVAQPIFLVGAALLVPSCVAGLAAVVVRWRGSDGLVRRQVAVLLVTAAILVVDILLQPLMSWPLGALTQAVAVALVPVGIGIAVTRHRLYDLDLAVCRAIGGLSLAVCLAGVYVSLFLIASAVLPGGPTVGAATAAAACGLLLHPLGVRLNRGVDRMFYGDRADPARVLEPPPQGSARASTSPRCPGGSVASSSSRCGSAPPHLSSTKRPWLRWARRPGHRPTCRCGTAVRSSAPSASPRGRVSRAVDARRRAAVGGLRPGRASDRRTATLRPAPAQPGRAGDRPRGGAPPAAPRPARRCRGRAGRRPPPGRDRARPGDRPGRGRPAPVRGRRRRDRRRRRARDHRRPAPGRARRPRARCRPARAGRPDGHARHRHRRAGRPGGPLPAAVEVACYRIAAEALANAIRHSDARRVAVHLDGTPTWVSLEVQDDGVGLPGDRAPAASVWPRCASAPRRSAGG